VSRVIGLHPMSFDDKFKPWQRSGHGPPFPGKGTPERERVQIKLLSAPGASGGILSQLYCFILPFRTLRCECGEFRTKTPTNSPLARMHPPIAKFWPSLRDSTSEWRHGIFIFPGWQLKGKLVTSCIGGRTWRCRAAQSPDRNTSQPNPGTWGGTDKLT
jgi:hypothetical protein